MRTLVGLWLDHKDAVMTTFTGHEPIVSRLHSKLRRKSKSTGGSRKALPYAFDGGGAYKKIEHKRENLLREYYENISQHLLKADGFVVMGPGEAKKEFTKFISKNKTAKEKLMAVSNADRMTDRQIVAKTRKFFDLEYEPLKKK